jgi:hypothetical protein
MSVCRHLHRVQPVVRCSEAEECVGADWYFPVIFSPVTTLSLKLSMMKNSKAKGTRHIIIQPWLPDGSPRQRITADVPVGRTIEVRVDMHLDKVDIGWMQFITERGDLFQVEVTVETLDSNTLKAEHWPSLHPMPPRPNASRSKNDLSQVGNNLIVTVMNVADHPIDTGMCNTDYLDCSPSSHRTVMPRSTLVFPIPDPHSRYAIVESSGTSVAAILDIRSLGFSIQTFESNSTIRYLPIK